MKFQELEFSNAAQRLGLVALYAHGSQVKGGARPDSDLDLAMLVPRDWHWTRFEEASEELCQTVARSKDFPVERIQVQDLRDSPPYFRLHVLTHGVLLGACDPTELARFQARSFCEAWDEQIFMKPLLESFSNRVREGRFAS